MSIRETFSNTSSLPVTNYYDQGAKTHISTVLGKVTIFLVEASSETRLFSPLSDYVFGVRNFENTNSMRVIFKLKMFGI